MQRMGVKHSNQALEMNPDEDWLCMMIQFPPEMVENWWRYGGEVVTK